MAKKKIEDPSNPTVRLKVTKKKLNRMKIQYLSPTGTKGFSILAGINRAIRPSHVMRLAKSLLLMGIVRPVVIARMSFISGKMDSYLIDGQHLYMALLKMGTEIPYVTIHIKDKQDLVEHIALLNSSSLSWKLSDYVTAWAAIHEDYVFLNTMFQKTKIEYRVLMQCFMKNANNSTILKRGDFRVENRSGGIRLVDQLADCLRALPKMDRFSSRLMAESCLKVMKTVKEYKHDVFVAYLRKNKSNLPFVTQDRDMLTEFLAKAFKK